MNIASRPSIPEFIPESAAFTAEQRSWLNGFFAGVLSLDGGIKLLSDRIVMMTNGPAAHIGEVLDVPLSRPRRRLELSANPTYLKCRQRVLEFLYERHSFVEAA